ncbi:MAG: hypothetical protein QGG84_03330 [Rhodospirillales bacterium]|jgi:hypothetical protein|nr:hypothetical protein [Rhodospirillales bacterium]
MVRRQSGIVVIGSDLNDQLITNGAAANMTIQQAGQPTEHLFFDDIGLHQQVFSDVFC